MVQYKNNIPASGDNLTSEDFRDNFQILAQAAGLFTTAQTIPNRTVQVAAGTYLIDGTQAHTFSGGPSPVLDTVTGGAPSEVAIALLTIDANNVLTWTVGTFVAADPVAPTYPTDEIPLAEVLVTFGMLEITDSLITDVRPLINLGGGSGGGGTTGIQGVTGIQGITGLRGVTGLRGPTGIQGAQGNQGVTGAGLQGATGVQGTAGTQGVTGAGIQGATGLQGAQGDQGLTGIQGATGLQGATGPQGQHAWQGVTGSGVQLLDFRNNDSIYIQLFDNVAISGVTGVAGQRVLIRLEANGDTGLYGITGGLGNANNINHIAPSIDQTQWESGGLTGTTGVHVIGGIFPHGATGLNIIASIQEN